MVSSFVNFLSSLYSSPTITSRPPHPHPHPHPHPLQHPTLLFGFHFPRLPSPKTTKRKPNVPINSLAISRICTSKQPPPLLSLLFFSTLLLLNFFICLLRPFPFQIIIIINQRERKRAMTGLFRSQSCGLVGLTEFNHAPPSPFFHRTKTGNAEANDEEEEGFEDDEENDSDENPIATTPFLSPTSRFGGSQGRASNSTSKDNNLFPFLDILAALLRKSLVTCSVDTHDVSSMDISLPTEVRHVSHVTFDRFNGFLGLPTELEPDVPRKVPSASASVFGVSAKSMQCSYDDRGNSVPMILLMMQKCLYAEGGLKAEGIFRINAENSQEDYVREKLNNGVVPCRIDVHCLAGLIKAWLRELPSGVLDSLTPEQVMHCNTEDDCIELVKSLPSTEAALLDWAINLMADVVQHEKYNKMNARNIAMVFAPNMTQMGDPLTALIHAVQVMNFLKTLILKTLREREESAAKDILSSTINSGVSCEQALDACESKEPATAEFLRAATLSRLECGPEEKLWSFWKSDGEEEVESISGNSMPNARELGTVEIECRGGYDNRDRLSLRRRLRRHPVFQLSKLAKKTRNIGIVNTRGGGEGWV